jgi:SP family facilitated glucose transporter-like MFS transporter 1
MKFILQNTSSPTSSITLLASPSPESQYTTMLEPHPNSTESTVICFGEDENDVDEYPHYFYLKKRLSNSLEPQEKLQSTMRLYLAVFGSILGSFQFGWSLSQFNFSAYHNRDDCDLVPVPKNSCILFPGHTAIEWTLIINMWILGGAIGALFFGIPADKYGRKRVLEVNSLFIILGAAIQASAVDVWMLVLGRFFAGIGSGCAFALATVYTTEIASPQQRTTIGTFAQVAVVSGLFAVTSTFLLYDPDSDFSVQYHWRLVAGFPLVLGILHLILSYCCMVESPAWLLSEGNTSLAEEQLEILYGKDQFHLAKQVFEQEYSILEKEVSKESPTSTTTSALDEDETPRNFFQRSIFSSKYARSLRLSVGIAIFHQLTGINAVFYYSSFILRQAGVEDERYGNVLVSLWSLIPTIFCLALLKCFHKRTILLTGLSFMLLSSIAITLAIIFKQEIASIVSMATYVASSSFSIGPLAAVVIADLFSEPQVRADALSLAACTNWLGNLIIGVSFPYMANALGMDWSFVPFSGCLVVFVLFLAWFLPCEVVEENLSGFSPTISMTERVDMNHNPMVKHDDNREESSL